MAPPVQLLAVIQHGRLAYEALLFMASWARQDNSGQFEVILAEPQPGPNWDHDPRLADPEVREMLVGFGAQIRPFETKIWGSRYPNGNKIEALDLLDPTRPFVFFDTDTLFLAPLADAQIDYSVPAASARVEPTWPRQHPGDAPAEAIWTALYEAADLQAPHAFPYFNAGVFCAENAAIFASEYRRVCRLVERDAPQVMADQPVFPWLDQIALPLVLTALGGPGTFPKGGIDGAVTCHWRSLPLLYARESDAVVHCLEALAAEQPIKRLLKRWEPARRMIYRGEGAKARALFADGLPQTEAPIRKALKSAGLWIR